MTVQEGFSPEAVEKINAFIDREAGKDAPLTADDEAEVRLLLSHNSDARRLAVDFRKTNNLLSALFDDVKDVRVPDSIEAMIKGLADEDVSPIDLPKTPQRPLAMNPDADDNIVALRKPIVRNFSYAPLAAAASIVAVLSLGALLHFYADFQKDQDKLTAKLDATTQLLASRDSALAIKGDQLAQLSSELLDRSAALDQVTTKNLEAETTIHSMRSDLERELITEQTLAQERLAALQAREAVAELTQDLSEIETERLNAALQVISLENALTASKSWLGQVAQYHRVYASAPPKRLVEAGADEKNDIERWLGEMIGRELVVPDLTEMGVTFVGARLLGVNEKPVAQLVYRDRVGRSLALCIIANPSGEQSPAESKNRDLNIIDWRDESHAFAIVGWSDLGLLNTITNTVRPIYEL